LATGSIFLKHFFDPLRPNNIAPVFGAVYGFFIGDEVVDMEKRDFNLVNFDNSCEFEAVQPENALYDYVLGL